jgi:hypothetical protein
MCHGALTRHRRFYRLSAIERGIVGDLAHRHCSVEVSFTPNSTSILTDHPYLCVESKARIDQLRGVSQCDGRD